MMSNIIPIAGDIFTDCPKIDGIAIFIPCGLTEIRSQAKDFVEQNKNNKNLVIYYDENQGNDSYDASRVATKVNNALDFLSERGARIIAMNAIRTTLGAGGSERLVKEAVENWLREKEEIGTFTIYLVDKRGGFNSL